MNTDLDDLFAAMAERRKKRRDAYDKRNAYRSGYRTDDPLNLALGNWRIPNSGPLVPNPGMAARIAA